MVLLNRLEALYIGTDTIFESPLDHNATNTSLIQTLKYTEI